MVAGLTNGRAKYAHVAEEMRIVAHRAGSLAVALTALAERDASVLEALPAAYKQSKGTDEAASSRSVAIERNSTRRPGAAARAVTAAEHA
jgi:formiminotetrahydrofolate cyclodeaminase